ncbi:MAG: sulfotransferase family protein [Angustibacter sp.]
MSPQTRGPVPHPTMGQGRDDGRDPARLVFVAGLHRSGTTPLARVISQHPQISGLTETGVKEDEGQHLQPVYPPARAYGGAGRFARDPRAHLTEESPLVSPGNAARLWQAWEPYWDVTDRFLVEKSPPNLVMGRFLQALFPGSAYVAVMRHPVVVALSTEKWRRLWSRHWWNHTSIEEMVQHWVLAHEILWADLRHLSRARVLRYEDVVADPAGQLAVVQQLLGLATPIPAVGIEGRSDRYEQRWREMATGPVWERRRRRRIIDRFGPALERFGYDVEDLRARSDRVPDLSG